MDSEIVRGYFNNEATVRHYARAVANVGLWESEKLLFAKWLRLDSRILDLGCGAGRVAIGLWEEGFTDVRGADVAEEMAREASEIADCLGCPVSFERQDALSLGYAAESFDAVIFAFNGLMQIPGRSRRLQAMGEVRRALRRDGLFIFTSLDREDRLYSKVFADPTDFDHDLSRNPALLDYGDRHFLTEHGTTFMHVPTQAEVRSDLASCGFEVRETLMRSELGRESAAVLDFSEDCRFWVAAPCP